MPAKKSQKNTHCTDPDQTASSGVCYSDKHFQNSRTDNQHFVLEGKEESVQSFRIFPIIKLHAHKLAISLDFNTHGETGGPDLPWKITSGYR